MGFGGKMDHGIDGVAAEKVVQQRAVANIPAHEGVAGRVGQLFQVLQAAGVGQGIQVDDMHARIRRQQSIYKIGADETRSTGDEYILHAASFGRIAKLYLYNEVPGFQAAHGSIPVCSLKSGNLCRRMHIIIRVILMPKQAIPRFIIIILAILILSCSSAPGVATTLSPASTTAPGTAAPAQAGTSSGPGLVPIVQTGTASVDEMAAAITQKAGKVVQALPGDPNHVVILSGRIARLYPGTG